MEIEIGSEWVTDSGLIVRATKIVTDEIDGTRFVIANHVAVPGTYTVYSMDVFLERCRPASREVVAP